MNLFRFLFFQYPILVNCASFERGFKAPSLCFRDPDPGQCPFFRNVWYFDHRARRCSKFPYGGCRGNANRFESQNECMKLCAGLEHHQSEAIQKSDGLQLDTWEAVCLLEPHAGVCPDPNTGQGRRGRYWYFYNASSGLCEEFLYFGCGGNNNRFATSVDCKMACEHVGIRWKVKTCDDCDESTSLCSRQNDGTSCRCRQGFQRNLGGICIDLDECESKSALCDHNAWCINTPGSYLCTCMTGFAGDGRRCSKGAIIELPPAPTSAYTQATTLRVYSGVTTKNDPFTISPAPMTKIMTYDPWLPSHTPSYEYNCHRCHKNATCWYGKCQCKEGYTGDGQFCKDIDECISGSAGCASGAACYNTVGSFYCKCQSGYAGNGFFCLRDKRVCSEAFDSHYREQCGEAYFQRRYYFDQRYRQCRMFWYDNCRGTSRNVFPDLDTCQSYCEDATQSPTRAPDHHRHALAVVTLPPGGAHKSVITPSPQCSMPCQPGACYGAYFMYYYNASSRACVPFIYTGCGGNENRFLTKSSCEGTCLAPPHTPELDCLQPVDYGYGRYDKKCQPFASYAWFYDQDGDECARFWYQGCGGNVNRFSTEQECKLRCIGRSQKLRHHPKMMPFRNIRDCFQEKKEGYCYYIENKPRDRYYYDHTDRQCKVFSYNGCGGNTNRFGSKEFCDSTCQETFKPKSKLCMYWVDIGPCNDMQTMWYFDLKTGNCQPFFWSGCGGNLNRFRSREDCESICVSQREDPCTMQKQPGQCSEAQQRFYYDPAFSICRPFIYGGCNGNENRFLTIDECRMKCERFETSLPSLKNPLRKNRKRKKRIRRKSKSGD